MHTLQPGAIFGRLTAVRKIHGRRWLFVCACGSERDADRSNVLSGRQVSCGCLAREATSERSKTHGMSRSKIYSTWRSMLNRCRLQSFHAFEKYSRRGVCVEWLSFAAFIRDMGGSFRDGLTLERKNNSLGYSASNCRWATMEDQNRNKENSRLVSCDGKTLCLAAWSDVSGVPYHCIKKRLNRGWDSKRAIFTPSKGKP